MKNFWEERRHFHKISRPELDKAWPLTEEKVPSSPSSPIVFWLPPPGSPPPPLLLCTREIVFSSWKPSGVTRSLQWLDSPFHTPTPPRLLFQEFLEEEVGGCGVGRGEGCAMSHICIWALSGITTLIRVTHQLQEHYLRADFAEESSMGGGAASPLSLSPDAEEPSADRHLVWALLTA